MTFRKPFRAVPIQFGARYRSKRRRERVLRFLVPVGVLGGAALVGGTIGILPVLAPVTSRLEPGEVVSGCTVTDGDTIRCGNERIRLLGIDAPELPGHCRTGRVCAPGDPYASTASLEVAMTGELRIVRVGEDRYGRTFGMVRGAKGDLSCWQLGHAQAIYRGDWDNGGRVATTCAASRASRIGKRSAAPVD
jgi:hypothetical protein